MKRALLILGASVLLFAQTSNLPTTIIVQKQLQVVGGTPGDQLVVGSDGKSVTTAHNTVQTYVLASPASPGCVLQTDGSYKFPRVPVTWAVFRNGLRASVAGEFTVTGDTLKFSNPIPGETVLCDYAY